MKLPLYFQKYVIITVGLVSMQNLECIWEGWVWSSDLGNVKQADQSYLPIIDDNLMVAMTATPVVDNVTEGQVLKHTNLY